MRMKTIKCFHSETTWNSEDSEDESRTEITSVQLMNKIWTTFGLFSEIKSTDDKQAEPGLSLIFTFRSSPSVPSNTKQAQKQLNETLNRLIVPSFLFFFNVCLHHSLMFSSLPPRCLYVLQFPVSSSSSSILLLPSTLPSFLHCYLWLSFLSFYFSSPHCPACNQTVYLLSLPEEEEEDDEGLHRLSGGSCTVLTQLCRQRNISAPLKQTQLW